MLDKELFKLLGGNKKYIFYTVALMVLGLFANVCITASICWAISLVVGKAEPIAYVYPTLCALVGIVVRYTASRSTGDLKDVLGRKVKKDLRERTYNKIVKLGVRSTDGMSMAGLTQVSMEGVEQLDLYYSSYLPQFFYAMLAPIILFCITVWIDWRVALVLLACVPLIPVSIVAVSKYAKKIFAKYWGKYTSMGDKFLDSVQGLKELKIFKADEAQHGKMNESSEEFRKITMKVLVMQLASTTIMDLVAYGGAGVGIALAVLGVVNWGLNPIAALFLILVAVDFFLPLRAFGSAFHVAMNGASAGRKIISLLEQPDPVWGKESVTGTEIRLRNVTFSYDGQRDVLKKVDMEFPVSGMTAIVGESGSGKSTVVNMLVGAFRPKEGEITVGGKPLEKLSRESYYGRLAVVSYNTYIFNETVRANFLLARGQVCDEDIYAALEKVNLADFIRENGGLDKVITEDANNISGGQKQRLALAVNLVADKDIYVFDEATSNIDVESEGIIMRNKLSNSFVWVGLDNFKQMFTELGIEGGVLRRSFTTSLEIYGLSFLKLPWGILFPYYIYKKCPGSKFFKAILYLPHILSGMVLGLIFKEIANNLVPEVFESFGIMVDPLLTYVDTKFWTIWGYGAFFSVGEGILLWTALMSRIPESLVEYCKLEGCGPLREFKELTLPLVFGQVAINLVAGVAAIFTNDFGLYTYYGSGSTNPTTIGYYTYCLVVDSDGYSNYSYASTIGVFCTCIAAPITLVLRWALDKVDPKVQY